MVTGVKPWFSLKNALSPLCYVLYQCNSCICIRLTPLQNLLAQISIWDHRGQKGFFTKNAVTSSIRLTLPVPLTKGAVSSCNLGSFGYDGNPLIDTPNSAKTTSKGRHIYVYHVNVSPPPRVSDVPNTFTCNSNQAPLEKLLQDIVNARILWSIYFHTPTSKMLPEKHNHMNSCCA